MVKDCRYFSVSIDLFEDETGRHTLSSLKEILSSSRHKDAEEILRYLEARELTELYNRPDVDVYCIQTCSEHPNRWVIYNATLRKSFVSRQTVEYFPIGTHLQEVKKTFWKKYKIDIDRLPKHQRLSQMVYSNIGVSSVWEEVPASKYTWRKRNE